MKAVKKIARKQRSKATENSDEKDILKLFDKLIAEKEPAVPQGFAEALERSITGAGADAVMAIAFLSRPFKATAEKIRDDRDTAKAFADAAAGILESSQKYKGLADLMKTAELRIHIALCQREDVHEIAPHIYGAAGAAQEARP